LRFASTSAWINQVRTAHQSQRPLNLLIRSPSTEAGSINAISRISSDDSADVEQRPMLTVSYRGHIAPSLTLPSPESLMTAFSQQTFTATTSNANVLRWQQMTGPAELVITSPSGASTGIQAPAPGIYTIAVTAQNALAETRTTATLDVMSAMEAWRLRCFSRRDNAATAANLADPDGDGIVNLLEYATGNSPLSTTPAIGEVRRVDSALVFEHARLADSADPGLVYHVEWSEDLLSWHTNGVTNAVQASTDGGKTIRWRSSIPIETRAKFFRLRVIAP
jgi:hypothetical protein